MGEVLVVVYLGVEGGIIQVDLGAEVEGETSRIGVVSGVGGGQGTELVYFGLRDGREGRKHTCASCSRCVWNVLVWL